MTWIVGQKAVISRAQVVTIERVTKSGWAVVGGRLFNLDGTERASRVTCGDKLELLTPEIQSEMDFKERACIASKEVRSAIICAEVWSKRAFWSWGGSAQTANDVDKAERLSAAIRSILQETKP